MHLRVASGRAYPQTAIPPPRGSPGGPSFPGTRKTRQPPSSSRVIARARACRLCQCQPRILWLADGQNPNTAHTLLVRLALILGLSHRLPFRTTTPHYSVRLIRPSCLFHLRLPMEATTRSGAPRASQGRCRSLFAGRVVVGGRVVLYVHNF